jgi:hypothetical protein
MPLSKPATKKPRPTKELTAALAEVEALKKKLADAERMREYHSGQASKAERDLDAMHSVFDAIPGIPKKRDESASYVHDRSVVARFAAWLAVARIPASGA